MTLKLTVDDEKQKLLFHHEQVAEHKVETNLVPANKDNRAHGIYNLQLKEFDQLIYT